MSEGEGAPSAKKVKQATFPCIGRDGKGDLCERNTHKGLCDIRGRCSKSVREALEDLFPAPVPSDHEDLRVSLKLDFSRL